MPDISKCLGKKGDEICLVREKCYRFTSVASEPWQAYTEPNGDFVATSGCDYFWDNTYGEKNRK